MKLDLVLKTAYFLVIGQFLLEDKKNIGYVTYKCCYVIDNWDFY